MSVRRLSALFLHLLLFTGCATGTASPEPNVTRTLGTVVTTTDPATLLVDRADDVPEIMACSTTIENDCTLRSAITIANENPAITAILFSSDYRIVLADLLPPISANNLVIQTEINQEVHVNGNNLPGNVFQILGSEMTIDGFRIYGSGVGFSNVWVTGSATNVRITNNIIGDDDVFVGECGLSPLSYGGIYVDAKHESTQQTAVWIYNNIIECHEGSPGDGITIATSGVFVGQDSRGQASAMQKNEIRKNVGYAVRLGNYGGNTIQYTVVEQNGGTFSVENFNNNLMYNTFR